MLVVTLGGVVWNLIYRYTEFIFYITDDVLLRNVGNIAVFGEAFSAMINTFYGMEPLFLYHSPTSNSFAPWCITTH